MQQLKLILFLVFLFILPQHHFAQKDGKPFSTQLNYSGISYDCFNLHSLIQMGPNKDSNQKKSARPSTNSSGYQTVMELKLDSRFRFATTLPTPQINHQRLTHIRKLYSQYPAIQLPFHYQTSDTVSHIPAEEPLDTLIFGEYIPVYVIGILPDTSNYFCFFYFIPADDALPAVATFNKKGELISRKCLIESCWKGAESDCEAILSISPKLEISFSYREYLYEADDEGYYSNTPYEASGYIETSKIAENGEWILIERVEQSQEELFKNPIIHDIWRD